MKSLFLKFRKKKDDMRLKTIIATIVIMSLNVYLLVAAVSVAPNFDPRSERPVKKWELDPYVLTNGFVNPFGSSEAAGTVWLEEISAVNMGAADCSLEVQGVTNSNVLFKGVVPALAATPSGNNVVARWGGLKAAGGIQVKACDNASISFYARVKKAY